MKQSWTLPIRLQSPNIQKHWTARHKETKQQQRAVRLICKELPKFQLPCEITIIRYGKRNMDHDNFIYSCKYIRDCCSDMLRPGLAPGQADGTDLITWRYEQRLYPKYQVEIIAEEK